MIRVHMQIAVVGLGYVGLVTAACLARLGQKVVGYDTDRDKLHALENGEPPFYEPGLEGELAQSVNLTFTADPAIAMRGADVVLICVGTPSGPSGEADLRAVMGAATTIADHLSSPAVVALRSTVPVGTTRRVEFLLNERLQSSSTTGPVAVLANPEFLRTGRALDDFLRPSRVVLGRADLGTDDAVDVLARLYRPLNAPLLVFDAESAELIKNAANTYLATRISFINELAALCEATGASIESVIDGIASDPRIGRDYLRPGIGYGGSCLPKDVRSLIAMGQEHGQAMLLAKAVDGVNVAQPARIADRLDAALGGLRGTRIGLLGLAFKPDTDDIRDSPALALAHELKRRGAEIVACDPEAAERVAETEPWIEISAEPIDVARGADGIVLATEWPAYVTLDYGALADVMRQRLVFDARNALDPSRFRQGQLRYFAIGTAEETAA
jgi:UDPglucose 6-dehydrogenase